MVDLDVRPGEPVVRPLLEVKGVELVGLRRGSGHQPIENRRVVFDTGARQKEIEEKSAPADAIEIYHVNGDQKAKKYRLKNTMAYKNSDQPHAKVPEGPRHFIVLF